MFKNFVVVLILLFVSVQIAWYQLDRIITLLLIATKMLFAIGVARNAIENVQNEVLMSVDADIADRWGLRMIDFCEQIVHKLRIIGHD